MSDDERNQRFDGMLTPVGGVGVPAVRTRSDEYHDVPEPVDSEREPVPDPPGLLRRLENRLRRLRMPRA